MFLVYDQCSTTVGLHGELALPYSWHCPQQHMLRCLFNKVGQNFFANTHFAVCRRGQQADVSKLMGTHHAGGAEAVYTHVKTLSSQFWESIDSQGQGQGQIGLA